MISNTVAYKVAAMQMADIEAVLSAAIVSVFAIHRSRSYDPAEHILEML